MTGKTEAAAPAASPSTPTSDEKEKKPVAKEVTVIDEVREQCRLIERTVVTKESRFAARVLRGLFALRKRLDSASLKKIINGFYTHSNKERDDLLAFVAAAEEAASKDGSAASPADAAMDTTDETSVSSTASSSSVVRLRGAKSAMSPLLPEVDCYLHLLVLLHLLDKQGQARRAVDCADALVKKILSQNRRSLDHIAARSYYYYMRAYEAAGEIDKIRGFLHGRLRTATLRNDFEGQAVLINCLLRSYINHNLFDQADKLVNKTVFPESANNNEWARYLYYLGRIKAIQLEYSEAHKHLVQSLRKAPQYSANGFRHTVLKLSIVVELLLGDIPERQTFLQKANRAALAPYLKLTQAVKSGDVNRFQEVLDSYVTQFRDDHTFTLILRLHHNVIKTAIRTISLAYSRISLHDVAKKLRLESAEDAEYIIAKAIRDGVIEATLDHDNEWMQSKETTDIYCTREPQLAFHRRIEFCLGLHNSSVRAMRFPPKSYNQDLESAEDRREREAQDLELAKEMAEEDDDMI